MTNPRTYLAGIFPNLIFYNEPVTDDCILGVAFLYDHNDGFVWCVAYCYESILSLLFNDFGSYEESLDWYDYNILGTHAGHATPAFLNLSENTASRFNRDFDSIIGLDFVKNINSAYEMVKNNKTVLFVPMSDIEEIVNYV